MALSEKDLSECEQLLKDKFPATVLDETQRYFFMPDLYARFARQHDGSHEKAAAALQACLDWRAAYKPHCIDPAVDCAAILKTKFLKMGGIDRTGGAVMLITLGDPSFRDVPTPERVRLFVWAMEELMRRGQEYFSFISDFSLVGKEKDKNGAATREESTRILDFYYPDRMTRTFMYNPPWFIASVAPLSMAFMSARMKARTRINCKTKDLLKEIAEDQLPTECGGTFMTAENMIDGMKVFGKKE